VILRLASSGGRDSETLEGRLEQTELASAGDGLGP
jgi:hypothetical protein